MLQQSPNQEHSSPSPSTTQSPRHKIDSDESKSENETVNQLKVTPTPGVLKTDHDAEVTPGVVDSISVPTPWVKTEKKDVATTMNSFVGHEARDQSKDQKSEVNISARIPSIGG